MRSVCLSGFCAIALTACSTVDRGTRDHIRIDTVPQGASVTVTTDERLVRGNSSLARFAAGLKTAECAATPCAIAIDRNDRALVTIEAPGYETVEYVVRPSGLRGGMGVRLGTSLATTAGAGAYVGASFGMAYNALTLQPILGGASAVPAAATVGTLGVAATAMMVDVGTAANKNLFPNPVVIGLPNAGDELPPDPMVSAFKAMLDAQSRQGEVCKAAEADRSRREECTDRRVDTQEATQAFRTLEREADAALRAHIQATRTADVRDSEASDDR